MEEREKLLKEGKDLFLDFLNLAENIYDQYYEDDDGNPEVTDDGAIRSYKSKELLTWMGSLKKWCESVSGRKLIKEDRYDYMRAKNPAINTLAKELGLEIE